MKKIFTLLLLAVAGMYTCGLSAQEVIEAREPVQQHALAFDGQLLTDELQVQDGEIKEAQQLIAQPAKPLARHARKRAIASASDLTGKYVMTYRSLTSSAGDGGSSVTITKVTDDTVLITNFYASGVAVKAAIDVANKTISIPNQVAAYSSTYGDCDIAVISSAGAPLRDVNIEGTFDDEGNISFTSWWGLFVVSGTYADRYIATGYNTLIEPANGNMNVTIYEDTTAYDWNIVVAQTGRNLVTVKNFGNHGQTVEIVLNTDASCTIANQLAWAGGSTMGNFYTYATDWSTGKLTAYNITGRVFTDEITWGNWAMYSSNNYYTGKYADATITGINFVIPEVTVTELDGSGTESDPFRIRTLDDLIYLANAVNTDENLNYGGPYIFHTKSFLGNYFVIENDIDMTNYRFTPIGQDWSHRFAGTIDGQGHTLTGLNVSTGSNGYAGLFGAADTASVIKNIIFKDIKVAASYYYAGAIGISYGSLENLTVNGTVSNSGVGAGGVVGVGTNVKNCSFEGTVNGTGGIAGGVAGQVYGTLDGCYALAYVNVSAKTQGYTGGGVVGTMYGPNSKCLNSYFSGTVNGMNYNNLYVGGVVGQNYRGVINGCFSVADVYGYDSGAAVGGVVGVLNGELYNSYATGYVQSTGSKTAGGIVGSVRYYIADGDTVNSVVKNAYFAGRLKAESYLYDATTGVRETLGTIYTGANPTIENIYYDQQMVANFHSEHYSALTNELTSASGPEGFDASMWTFTEGYYPRLKAIADNDAANMSASVLALDTEFPDNVNYVSVDAPVKLLGSTQAYLYVGGKLTKTGYCGSIVDDTYVLNKEFGTDTLVFYNAENTAVAPRFFILTVSPKFFEGAGKEENPFQIKTKADMEMLAHLVTELDQHFPNVYFKMMNDIDMENDTSFLGIACSTTDITYNKFAGTFDGGGHALHNLWIYYVSWTTEPTDDTEGTPNSKGPKSSIYKGLFGSLDQTGVVKNLTLASDCQFDVWGYAGCFVGNNYGTVENCKNFATIRCYSTTGGGIVGQNNKTAVVRNCLNAGHIIGGWSAYGGICGSTVGTVENCMNVGTVEAREISTFQTAKSKFNYVGGIAGRATGSILNNLVNAGHITAAGGNAGGLFGNFNSTSTASDYYAGNNDLYQAINYGTVFTEAPATTGAIGGNGYSSKAEFKNVYYDKQVTGLGAAANDINEHMTGALTSDLISGEILDGFSSDVWTFVKGQYPVLKLFADEPIVKEAAQTILSLNEKETVKSLVTDGSVNEGPSWSLTDGTQFSLDGTTLKVPAVTTDLIYDTLNVTNGDFITHYALVAITPIPVDGTGTLEDPFVIHDPATWDAFANYMALTGNSFAGKYVAIVDDINFADTTFVPFGSDGVTIFNGILLGNGHTVSGINFTADGTYQGVIYQQGAVSVVQDLTIEGTMTTAKSYVGGFFGKMSGKAINCVSKVNVTGTAASIGGFAGYATSSASFEQCYYYGEMSGTKGNVGGFVGSAETDIRFIDCVNEGTVTNTAATKNVGGFVGSGYGTWFERCVNKGTIANDKGSAVGGFQGLAAGIDTIFFYDCYNEAPVSGGSSVAGLLGSTATSTSYAPIIANNCYNTGNITSLLKATYGTGGLFGMLTARSRIDNCYNTGAINVAQAVYTGGIWGYHLGGTTEEQRIYVNNCYNAGPIVAVNYGSGMGTVPAYTTITNCYNLAKIEAALGGAGIGDVMGHEVFIDHCWNAGDITTTKNGAGGINGYGNYRAYISNCWNVGNITAGTQAAGGLGGQTRSVYTNCYNRGNVTAPKMAGGLVGQSSIASSSTYTPTSFYNCYNAGLYITGDTLVGNIVGNTATWNPAYGNVCENTYYITDFNGGYACDTIGGIPITVAELAETEELPGTWNYNDQFTFPTIPGFEDNAAAKAFAVAVVLNDGDTYDHVTTWFHLGNEDGTTWASDNELFYWNSYDNIGYLHDAYYGLMNIYAECEGFIAYWPLTFSTTSGINEQSATKTLVGETYYNVAGQEIAKPDRADGQVYIIVRTYSDGTKQSVKVRN